MDSELQRLRFRIRQLEREVRALRNAARAQVGSPADDGSAPPRRAPAPVFARRVLKTPPTAGTAGD